MVLSDIRFDVFRASCFLYHAPEKEKRQRCSARIFADFELVGGALSSMTPRGIFRSLLFKDKAPDPPDPPQ